MCCKRAPPSPCPTRHTALPQARDWGFTGLSYVPLNNTQPSRQHMRWERLVLQDGYRELSE